MPMKRENDYLIDFDAIPQDVAKRARMMVVSYPNNPTGAVANDAFYERAGRFCHPQRHHRGPRQRLQRI